jgi:hypothetical protein
LKFERDFLFSQRQPLCTRLSITTNASQGEPTLFVRDAMTHAPLLKRIRAEYLEMPGLQVTLPQAQRLFGLEWAVCQTLFDELVNEQFLHLTARGMYARASDGEVAQAAPAKADVDHRRSEAA